jgi:hypothetical protein
MNNHQESTISNEDTFKRLLESIADENLEIHKNRKRLQTFENIISQNFTNKQIEENPCLSKKESTTKEQEVDISAEYKEIQNVIKDFEHKKIDEEEDEEGKNIKNENDLNFFYSRSRFFSA